MIEILTTGLANSVQDAGRPGRQGLGVGTGGAMDRFALAVGNALLGNDPGAAGVEVVLFPFRLRFHADVEFAVTGAECGAALDGRALPPCWAAPAKAGQTLALGLPRAGARAYVTVRHGIDVPVVLGARATDLKTGYGGHHGRGLERGDMLSLLVGEQAPFPEAGLGAAPARRLPPPGAEVTLRVLEAAETAAFDAESRGRFVDETWLLTNDADRMGFRLQGSALRRGTPAELLSHGIVPGTVQVPPSGQPMIQMADANTCGGYPKIASVIEADHELLAQAALGSRFRFVWTDLPAARQALFAQDAFLDEVRSVAGLICGVGR